ncbi:MAG: ABC transporter permease [Opitutales bacterium]|nr:ABC transporter permease [Opitutales bacterium]NRA25732.1 ABC transporter permease subunit [Opitutales bacterium]
MTNLWIIAGLTWREALRQKFVLATVFCSLGLVLSSLFFRQFDFGGQELKFVRDFGFGAMTLFGALLCIFATGQLFFSDLENRTVHLILARPVSRWVFVLGKALGVLCVVWAYLAAIGLTLALLLAWQSSQMDGSVAIVWSDLLVYLWLQGVRSCALVGVTLLVASYARSQLLTVMVGVILWIVFQLQHLARDAWENGAEGWQAIGVGLLRFCVPDFQLFDLGDQLVLRDSGVLEWGAFVQVSAYGLGFAVLYVSLAMFIFRKREI